MLQIYSKSQIGYSHNKESKPCQDYSLSYRDNQRYVISVCDGHGGNIYIRSQKGAEIAAKSIVNVFSRYSVYELHLRQNEELIHKIKLDILCEYNKGVEEQLSAKPFKKKETDKLMDEEKETLMYSPSKAYGTTLTGALLIGNTLLVASIGDSEVLGIKKGELIRLLEDEDAPAGNITYSMCQTDAYKYLNVKVYDFREFDGVLLCSDGLSSPYQSYENLNNSFIKPLMINILENKSLKVIDQYIDQLASSLGVGDDVSLAFIVNDNADIKNYSKEETNK